MGTAASRVRKWVAALVALVTDDAVTSGAGDAVVDALDVVGWGGV